MKVEIFATGIMSANCYLLCNKEKKEMVIIDPGGAPSYLLAHIKETGMTPKAILLTHGHFDHIMGIDGFLAEFPMPVYAHEAESVLLEDPKLNASAVYGPGYTYQNSVYTRDQEVLELAGFSIRVLHTPGHTIGGCCYYIEAERMVFTGDTLFAASVGRSDFPTGDGGTLTRSIEEKLMVLPEDTIVYPGHMQATSIKDEKLNNPFLRA